MFTRTKRRKQSVKIHPKRGDQLKQEEQQLTSRIQRINAEELEILKLGGGQRRRKQQEQFIQESQLQPQLVYQQLRQQSGQRETPNLSEEELRRLAIPLICNNWERNWDELMHYALRDRESVCWIIKD